MWASFFLGKEKLLPNTFDKIWLGLHYCLSCKNHPVVASINFVCVSRYLLNNSSFLLRFRHMTWDKYNTVFKRGNGIWVLLDHVILLFQLCDKFWHWSVYFWISDYIETECLSVFLSVELDHCPHFGCCVTFPEYVSVLLFLWLQIPSG